MLKAEHMYLFINSLKSTCSAVDSEKMSKSLGNFFTIRDVIQQYHPFVLRWFLLSSGYRAPINYTQRGLEEVRHLSGCSTPCMCP